ncbi:TIGR02234 family membrane protein [Streptomyces sp. NPDC059788]|uniref:TIGR02234 family membrane protein n=1 Tax=Streptomyces sp. NPDC059788 TaxID=3346948 RepID=UPI00366867E5
MTAVDHPLAGATVTSSSPSPKSARSGKSLALALIAGAAGAAVVLLASGRTWARATAVVAQGELPQTASGQDVTGVPGALAIVGLAALVALFAVRGAGRTAVAALLALSGLGTVVGAYLGLSDTAALREKAATATGLSDAGVQDVSHTFWPWAAVAGGLLLLVAGVLALLYGRCWPAMSGRYERAGAAPRGSRRSAAADPDRPEEMWKSLDRGEDPTR